MVSPTVSQNAQNKTATSRPAAHRLAFLVGWLLGCEQIIVLGTECPESRGVCEVRDGGRPSGAPDARVADARAPDARTDVPEEAGAVSDAADGTPDARVDSCDAGGLALVPLAHWPLDDGAGTRASDVPTHAADGTLVGFDTPSWVAGQMSGALRLDGDDDRVDVGAVEGEVRSLTLWLSPESTQAITSGTGVQPPTAHGPLEQWTTPENAYLEDDVVARTASLVGTSLQHWGGFHLERHLPSDAEILGITVHVATANVGVLGAFTVELSWDGGTSHTDSRYGWGQLIFGSNRRQAGGPDRLWGRRWTVSDLSDDNFRVRGGFGGIANSMALDFVGVEVSYVETATPRTILALGPSITLQHAGSDGMGVSTSGWPGSVVYVNGEADAALADGWNHVAVVSQDAVTASEVRLGSTTALAPLSHPFAGTVDDVALYEEALSERDVAGLVAPECQ